MLSNKILFVDDEPSGHESLRYILEARGYECLTATNMTAAMQILKVNDVAVVVTDIMMPSGKDYPAVDSQETGFYFVRVLKENWPRLPIVCLSVIGDQIKIRGLKRNSIEYLRKGEVPLSTAAAVIERAASGMSSY